MIYEPAEDSYLLSKFVGKLAFGSVLDIGTGSGIQVKKELKVKKSDLFSNVKGRFDTIIFNPPYLPLDKREPLDSRLATTGGKHGYETLHRFFNDLNDHLTKNGI